MLFSSNCVVLPVASLIDLFCCTTEIPIRSARLVLEIRQTDRPDALQQSPCSTLATTSSTSPGASSEPRDINVLGDPATAILLGHHHSKRGTTLEPTRSIPINPLRHHAQHYVHAIFVPGLLNIPLLLRNSQRKISIPACNTRRRRR